MVTHSRACRRYSAFSPASRLRRSSPPTVPIDWKVLMSLETLLDRNQAFAATDAVAKNPKIPQSSTTPTAARRSWPTRNCAATSPPAAASTKPTWPGCRPPTPPPPSATTSIPWSPHARYPPTSESVATSTTPPKALSTPSSHPPRPAPADHPRGQGTARTPTLRRPWRHLHHREVGLARCVAAMPTSCAKRVAGCSLSL